VPIHIEPHRIQLQRGSSASRGRIIVPGWTTIHVARQAKVPIGQRVPTVRANRRRRCLSRPR
jgi:hypothetical protein